MISHRLARLRQTKTIRELLAETTVLPQHLIAPLFLHATLTKKRAIPSMPGYYQLPLSALREEIDTLLQAGIRAVILFGIPHAKDETGSSSWKEDGIIQKGVRLLKEAYPELLIITDVCFCEYTDHGHCGIMENNILQHEKTLPLLEKQAISHAEAGADWVAPSGMCDGMVQAIRTGLDNAGYTDTSILSYAVKYHSCLYGPFREAAQGTPQYGDRSTYQMNPRNSNEALREAHLDIEQGADVLMVKPALFYLDIIYRLKNTYPSIPLCAYQVSGEYAMLQQAIATNLMNREQAITESLVAIKRAGADMIITYFAKEFGNLYRLDSGL